MANNDKDGENDTPVFLRTILGIGLLVVGIVVGFIATNQNWWIAQKMQNVRSAFTEVFTSFDAPWFLDLPRGGPDFETFDQSGLAPGLVLLTGIDAERRHFINVVKRDGTLIHSWKPDWFEIWPETPATIPAHRVPQNYPGSVVHGVAVTEQADVIFNLEFLSTVRLDICGDVVWKKDNLGHHSVAFDHDGAIWVGAERYGPVNPQLAMNHIDPTIDFYLQKLSPDGEILINKNIFEILVANDLRGLMHLSNIENDYTVVSVDTLHPNDVEPFPAGLESTMFETGDLLVSLRNINTIFVVDPDDWKIKFISTGTVLRQHDPDFGPNDTITVYDNHNLSSLTPNPALRSRIVEIDARTGAHRTLFKGDGPSEYYSSTMGRHQVLPNGNLMILSPHEGRAFEVDRNNKLIWQHFNNISDQNTGLLAEAHLLPPEMDEEFFEQNRKRCN